MEIVLKVIIKLKTKQTTWEKVTPPARTIATT